MEATYAQKARSRDKKIYDCIPDSNHVVKYQTIVEVLSAKLGINKNEIGNSLIRLKESKKLTTARGTVNTLYVRKIESIF